MKVKVYLKGFDEAHHYYDVLGIKEEGSYTILEREQKPTYSNELTRSYVEDVRINTAEVITIYAYEDNEDW